MLGGGTGSGGSSRSRVGTIVLLVLGALVLFAAGVGLSWLLRGGTGTTGSNEPTPGPTCVTTTVVPASTLPAPATVSVNVYNATDTTGLAARTAATMKARGFTVGDVDNDPLDKTIKASAEIRYGPKGKENAQLVRFYVAGAKLVADDRTDASVDLVLGEKFKNVRPQAAVDKAMNTPVVTSSGPGCDATPAASPSAS